jgi:hypothetical protein
MMPLVFLALVTAPTGWQGGANRELVEQTGKIGHFGGVHGVIEAERYDAPQPGVVLYVTRVAANVGDPNTAAAAELATFTHGTLEPKVVDSALDARIGWTEGDVTGAARVIIAATSDRIVAVKGECYAAKDGPENDVASCLAALGTLDVGVPVKDRVALTVPAAPPPPAATVPSLSAPSLTDQHVPMPPMTVTQARPGFDRRPVVAGAGLIVIAAIFWWNRRRRQSS